MSTCMVIFHGVVPWASKVSQHLRTCNRFGASVSQTLSSDEQMYQKFKWSMTQRLWSAPALFFNNSLLSAALCTIFGDIESTTSHGGWDTLNWESRITLEWGWDMASLASVAEVVGFNIQRFRLKVRFNACACRHHGDCWKLGVPLRLQLRKNAHYVSLCCVCQCFIVFRVVWRIRIFKARFRALLEEFRFSGQMAIPIVFRPCRIFENLFWTCDFFPSELLGKVWWFKH